MADARSWLGVPWVHQGRTRLGIDCAGIVTVIGNEHGLLSFDTTNYQRRTHGTLFLRYFRTHMDQKHLDDILPGDALLFRDSAFPCHCSIYSLRDGVPSFVHADLKRKKVVETPLSEADWMDRRVACFAYKGIGD